MRPQKDPRPRNIHIQSSGPYFGKNSEYELRLDARDSCPITSLMMYKDFCRYQNVRMLKVVVCRIRDWLDEDRPVRKRVAHEDENERV